MKKKRKEYPQQSFQDDHHLMLVSSFASVGTESQSYNSPKS